MTCVKLAQNKLFSILFFFRTTYENWKQQGGLTKKSVFLYYLRNPEFAKHKSKSTKTNARRIQKNILFPPSNTLYILNPNQLTESNVTQQQLHTQRNRKHDRTIIKLLFTAALT